MFGPLGLPELIMIFIVALLLFGPRKMPEIGRSVGRALGELRRASNDFKRTIEDEVAAEDVRQVGRDLRGVKTAVADVTRIPTDLVTGPADPEPTAPVADDAASRAENGGPTEGTPT